MPSKQTATKNRKKREGRSLESDILRMSLSWPFGGS
jgi:hypothetical protein